MEIVNNIAKVTSYKHIYVPIALILDTRLSVGARFMWVYIASLQTGTIKADAFDSGISISNLSRYADELERCGWLCVSRVSASPIHSMRYELKENQKRITECPGKMCCARVILNCRLLSCGARLTYFVLRSVRRFDNGYIKITQTWLGVNRNTAIKYINELGSARLVRRFGRRFELRSPSCFTAPRDMNQ